jgi:hypothetical protein
MDRVFGVAASIVTLAMVSIIIVNGTKSAAVVGATGTAFANSIKAATLR